MTAPDRETLAATIHDSLHGGEVCRFGVIPPLCKRLIQALATADALLAGPLAAPPGDGGGELPEDVLSSARAAAHRAGKAEADQDPLDRGMSPFVFVAVTNAAAEVGYAAGLAAGRADERAAVVGWLRADTAETGAPPLPLVHDLADAIERGEHRGE